MSLGSDAARPALRPLIEAFQVVHLRPVRADLLRALAALCSSADIIQEFETVLHSYFHRLIILHSIKTLSLRSSTKRNHSTMSRFFLPVTCSAEVWRWYSTFCATHAARQILKRNPKLLDYSLKSHLLGWTPPWKMPKLEFVIIPAMEIFNQIQMVHGQHFILRLTFHPSLRPWLVSDLDSY